MRGFFPVVLAFFLLIAPILLNLQVSLGAAGDDRELGRIDIVGDISGPRFNHTATKLRDGRVLIAGGTSDGYGSMASCEIYDPDKRTWKMTSPLSRSRMKHSAFLLHDGRVMVAGGYVGKGHPSLFEHYSGEGNRSLSSCEIFDPDTEEWTAGPDLLTGRFWQGSIVLSDGRSMVIGGLNVSSGPLSSCEIYDLDKGAWEEAPSMSASKARFSASLLKDGRVLVAGGHAGREKRSIDSCEIFDPEEGRWYSASSMQHPRGYQSGILLDDGRFMVSGGFTEPGNPDRTDGEIFDPRLDSWSGISDMSFPRHNHVSFQLDTGEVMIIGGSNCQTGGCHSSLEYYDIEHDEWSHAYLLVMGRKWSTVTELDDGTYLIAGGRACGDPTSRTEIYVPEYIIDGEGTGRNEDTGDGFPWGYGELFFLGILIIIIAEGAALYAFKERG